VQDPVPLYLGGGKPQTALRAARLGLGYCPNLPDPALLDVYRDECVRQGVVARVIVNPAHYAVFVAEDPEREWALLAPHAMHNSNAYARLAVDSPGMIPTHAKVFDDNDVAGLRSSGTCLVLTPGECIALAGENHARGSSLCFVPLLGGAAPEIGWRSLELFASRVKPRLADLGHLTDAPGPPTGADSASSGETVRSLPII
jgi:alkanesulfonate monooxygenase SsuD/methylene tetrahydromethanopterin reductase-like flavin-dependent oxidoreductase (luciferase family)